ncbi:hypothetical protein KTE54_12170 [Burkholderia multivorans]|uniref:hypothetical protein n=1 Tax=Burkholderia multivorans TaxID=87883 RepID=UPI001C25D911|nr:hypothetical protein [Burkholderia multivorans]MBU9561437.1 hypothetical protein [Burkholderia multivorans]
MAELRNTMPSRRSGEPETFERRISARKRRSSSPKADLAGVQTCGPESVLIEVSRDLRLDERGTAENVIGRGFEVQAFRDWQSVAAVVDFNITQMARIIGKQKDFKRPQPFRATVIAEVCFKH